MLFKVAGVFVGIPITNVSIQLRPYIHVFVILFVGVINNVTRHVVHK